MGQLPNSSTYRVVGAESSSTNPTGLKFRDYWKVPRDGGGSTVTPINAWRRLCEGRNISIPMLSKTGLLLSGSYQGTMRVFRIGEDGQECVQLFDSGVVAGKADFSANDRFLIYVSRAENIDTVYLADLSTGQIKGIYAGSEGSALHFPAFQSEDRVVIYDQTAESFIILDRTRTVVK